MRNEEEIKKFIDEKEVLTMLELAMFVYERPERNTKKTKILKWWGYVLETKDWKKLKEYNINKQTKHHEERFKKFREIYIKDERMKQGQRKQRKLLNDVYGLSYSGATISKYNQIICLQKNQ